MTTIRDFANEKGCTVQNVYKLIKRYKLELDGHVKKIGSKTFLDDYAQSFLSSYITPRTVVASDQELIDEINRLRGLLSDADHKNSELISQNAEMSIKLQNFNSERFLLEQGINNLEKDVERLETALNHSEIVAKQKDDELHLVKQQLLNKENELNKLRSRGWLARLLNKE